jgi:hypothetical protein
MRHNLKHPAKNLIGLPACNRVTELGIGYMRSAGLQQGTPIPECVCWPAARQWPYPRPFARFWKREEKGGTGSASTPNLCKFGDSGCQMLGSTRGLTLRSQLANLTPLILKEYLQVSLMHSQLAAVGKPSCHCPTLLLSKTTAERD